MTIRMSGSGTLPGITVPLRRVFGLGLVAGLIDALSYMDLKGIYSGAMTGNTVQLGINFVRHAWPQVVLVGGTLGAFFCGGIISSLIRRHLQRPAMELIVMAALMVAAQIVRIWVPSPIKLELPILAMSMAMQGETISRFGGMNIQTIVVTNNLLKCADGIVGRYLSRSLNAAERSTLGDIALPGSAWCSYLLGSGVAVLANSELPFPFLIPAVLLILTTLDLLFTPSLVGD